MLGRLLAEERPEYAAVAFDLPGPTFRHARFAGYKIHRPAMPESLIEQIPAIHALVAAFRLPIFELAGYEADDVLATLAVQLAARDIEVFLVTGDKDALQLVGPRVHVYNPQRDNLIMDATHVKERFGVEPRRVVDVMALMGDSTDNIPGVPGIGEKTAVELISRFGSLENVLAHLEDVPGEARRRTLAAHAEQARMARQLAEVDTQVPLQIELERLRRVEPDWAALRALYRDLEFRTLLNELPAAAPTASPAAAVRVAASAAEVRQVVDAVRGARRCTVLPVGEDTAPTALVLCAGDGLAHWMAAAADPEWRRLRAVLEDATIRKDGYDLKALWRRLQAAGITLRGLGCDVLIAAYLLNPAHGTYGVQELIEAHLGRTLAAPPSADATTLVDSSVEPWGALTLAVHELADTLNARLIEQALERLYHDVELPLCDVLARMEACGIAVDRAALAEMSQRMEQRLRRLTDEIFALAGETFNINSPKQLSVVLFERLKLPVLKRTKTGPSTDFDVLTRLAEQHPLPQRLVEFRELSKLKATYVDALPALIDPATRRLHTTFNQTVAATGRLSSSEPNLQNIPIRTELGRQIRRAFVPLAIAGDGWRLLSADYSQIELRVLAHLSGDPALVEAFRQGRDIHTFTASLIYGVEERDVTPAMRTVAKTTNFGLIYGMGAQGLSRDLGIPLKEAAAFIEAYFQRYPTVRAYLDGQIALAKHQGFVATLLGRRRYIPELGSPDGSMRAFGERAAINTPVQGSAADVIKVAMLRVDEAMRREGLAARLLLQVHDELVFEAPESELPALQRLVRAQMEGAITLRVPLVVTLKTGPNWLDLREDA